MNIYFIAAGVLAFAIGLIHSVFGEHLVFRQLRSSGFVPTNGGPLLRERHVRILWATWHLATVMAWGMGAILFWLALTAFSQTTPTFVVRAIVVSVFASSMLVLVGTKGKHPGWVGLLAMAIFAEAGLHA